MLGEEGGSVVEVGDARHDIEGLAAAKALPQQRLTQDHGIERRHIGAHREPVDRRRRDQRHLAHAGEGKLQRAGNGRRGQGQDVHVLAELLQALLMAHAEMLLLIDDQQAEIGELDGLAKQRMGADDDIDLAALEALLHLGELLGADEAGGLGDTHRQTAEALGEGLGMLAREQRGRHHDRDLLAGKHREQARAERHLGLAEADIAADQPVHRAAACQIVEHGIDARGLVLGLLIGKAGREFLVDAVRRGDDRRLTQLAQRRHLDQLLGDVADALLQPRFARLPARAAEPVELDARLVGAEAAQHLNILDRQKKLVAALIDDLEAIMRLARGLDGGEADEAADAVIGMHDEVAGGEARGFGENVAAAFGPCPAHEPVAENVLLADDRKTRCLEPCLERQQGETCGVTRSRQGSRKRIHALSLADPVLGQQGHQPLARAIAPAGNDGKLAIALDAVDMGNHRVEDIDALGLPLRRERASLPRAERHDLSFRSLRAFEWCERDHPAGAKRFLPLLLVEEHRGRGHRMIRRRAEGLALERL